MTVLMLDVLQFLLYSVNFELYLYMNALEKLQLNYLSRVSFCCCTGWVPEIQNWLYCLRHQITSPYKASLRLWLGGQLDQRRGTRPGTVTAVFVLCTVVQVSDSYLKGVKLHTCTIDIVLLLFKLQRLIPSGHIFYNSIHNAKLKKTLKIEDSVMKQSTPLLYFSLGPSVDTMGLLSNSRNKWLRCFKWFHSFILF